MRKQYEIIGDVEYVQGHLRSGYRRLMIDAEEWDSMTKEDQLLTLEDRGSVEVADWEIDDVGDVFEIHKKLLK